MNSRSSLSIAGIGRILVWNGGSLWIGRNAGRTGVHAHHALQITLTHGAPVLLRPATEDWSEVAGAIVRHQARHQFDGRGAEVAHVFVEPETTAGRALVARIGAARIAPLPPQEAAALAQPLFGRFHARATDATMNAAAQEIVERLAHHETPPAPIDPRIARALDALRARLADVPPLTQCAALVHLSASRFRHLFVAQTGTSFRAYVLWLRIMAAIASFNDGHNWTRAAHSAGFADSAHLSRTFRRMFGVTPVMLIKE